MQTIIDAVQADLQAKVEPGYREKMQTLFGVNVGAYWGVRVGDIRAVSAAHFRQVKASPFAEVLKVCEALLAERNYEQKVIAFDWAYRFRHQYTAKHFDVFERWLKRDVNDWNDCDDLCCHALGECVLQFPEVLPRVKAWTTSKNRWVRRAAAVSLIPSAHVGQNLTHCLDVADRLLYDSDDLVQKGYGWLLKECTRHSAGPVFDYIMTHRHDMPRTALRYAIEKLPDAKKKLAMQRP